MLNMWTNMTALHMQCIYFEFVRHVYLSELNTLNHPLSPDKYTCLTNSKYLHCMCGAVIFVHIFNIPHFICVTDLFKILWANIFIILSDICYAHIFRPMVAFVQIMCGIRICFSKLNICRRICLDCIPIKVFYICRRIVNTYVSCFYPPWSAVPFIKNADGDETRRRE